MCLPASSTFTSFLLLISLQLIFKADAVFTDAPLDGIATCRRLPHSNYLSAEQLMHACQHRAQWIRDRDKVDGRLDPTDSQRAYLDWLQSTREVRQPLTEGKKAKKKKLAHGNRQQKTKGVQERRRRQQEVKLPAAEEKRTGRKKFVRKEYRMLSDLERKDVQKALNALKERRIDNITIWDLHILVHYPNSAPAAHWGPAFLPWHREFLRQFEAALHNEVPELVGLPYWDSTLDHGLPDPADSVLWSEPLMGNGNGFVRNGPFKDWDTNVLMPLSPVPIKRLFRSTGGRSQDRLMSAQDAEWIASRRNFSELSFCQDKTFESMHGLSHVWVGGFMFVIRVSPNDPTFYLHHAFIDHLWEQFRHRNQDRKQRETEYAKKICNRLHAFDAQMKPFNLLNKDGLSNDYTDFWFEYEPVRHCSPGWPFCDSKFLFCDKTAWRCRSRIQLGGNCTGFAGTEICFESMCIQNICRLPATEGNGFPRREVDLPLGLFEPLLSKQRQQGGVVWAKALMLGDESVPLASGIAHVMVRDERTGENTTAFLERGPAEYPETKGLLYMPLPNPKDPDADFNVSLEASDHYGRYCQPYCLNSTTEKFQVCEPKLVLRSQLGGAASNISFTHQLSARKFLDMDLSVHPSRWKLESPFLVFSCQRKLLNSALVKDVTAQLLPPALSAAGQKPAEEISAQPQPHVWFRVGLLKRAGSGRDLDQLQIETEDVQNPNEVFVSSVPRARSSFDQSVLFVRARNPLLLPAMAVTVRVSVRKAGMRIGCEVRCNLADEASQEPAEECQSRVRLHADPRLSQEQVFSPEVAYLPFLGWRMVGHPSEWRLRMPYLALYC